MLPLLPTRTQQNRSHTLRRRNKTQPRKLPTATRLARNNPALQRLNTTRLPAEAEQKTTQNRTQTTICRQAPPSRIGQSRRLVKESGRKRHTYNPKGTTANQQRTRPLVRCAQRRRTTTRSHSRHSQPQRRRLPIRRAIQLSRRSTTTTSRPSHT